ncbi:translation initiation factor IF-2 [Anaerospora hongkongensis]|uniref:Translation initiation factor IF-2 n=2 Tax=Anaerospora hongkongensis TaxID=244830 RepID=A0A4R1Q3N4_9FIRM|nr:translation initiation factor IF-2 [Anaerospora hongkongensis]TCL40108.1 translation initiation factor IF-2 [Anaerospora hongkongensis]
MSKHRIYELAKDYSTTSKVIIDILSRNSITAKNHMSSVDDDAKVVLERTFARKTGNEDQGAKVSKPVGTDTAEKVNRPIQTGADHPAAHNAQHQSKPPVQREGQNNRPPYQQQHQGMNQQRPQQPQGQNNRPPYQQQQHQGMNQQRPQQPQGQNNRPPYQQQGMNQQRPQQPYGQNNRPPYQQQGMNQQRPQQPQGQNNRPPYQQQGMNQQRPQQPYGQNNRPPYQQQGMNQQRPQQPQGQNNRPPYQQQGMNQQRPQQPQGQNRPAFQQQSGNNQQRSNFSGNRSAGQSSRPQQGQQQKGRPQYGQQNNQNRNRGKDQGRQNQPGRQQPAQQPVQPAKPKVIKLGGSLTVKELSAKMGREVSEIIKKLMMLGVMATINQEVDMDTATILAEDFGIIVEELPPEEDPTEIPEIEDEADTLVLRPPVVTIMGHVDHGKTSLLDAIRQTSVTSQEAGGITQHIGAYQVNYKNKKIVFLDTPGHEAFTAMRARGAKVTDIAILVVAADDGVMPQTIEAINHAKSANVPIIVAVNKMDRPGANPDRVKQQLSEHGLISEEWGGETIMVPVSAQQKTGLSDLLEMVLLVAEMQELKANPERSALGTIIEAQLDKGRGPVATVLVQKGTLRIGDTIIAGTAHGKVRAMVNDRGEKVKKAEPSMPVEVLGLSDVPQAGDILAVTDEKTARAVAEKRIAKKRTDEMQQMQKVTLDDIFKQIQDGTLKDLNIVIKADVQGSIEALRQSLLALKNKEVRVNIIHAGVGAINESDVMLASASNALIMGFNVRPDANARKAAESEKVDLKTYRVIYEAINDVEAAMTGMLAPEYKEVIQGRLEVRKVISIPKAVVAGSYVLEGKITNSSQVRLIRDGVVVHEGKIDALRRFKDDVKEVATGYECGLSIEKFRDIKEGDIIEAFAMEVVKPGS